MNRKYFRPIVVLTVLLATVLVDGSEFYGYLIGTPVFGWVQAASVGRQEGRVFPNNVSAGLPVTQNTCPISPCAIRVEHVIGGAKSPWQRRWFPIFLCAALVLQTLLVALIIWVAAKIIFFLVLVYTSLPWQRQTSERQVLRIILNVNDSGHRFGLKALDKCYDLSLAIAFLGSLGFVLNRLSNVEKGSSFFSTVSNLPLIGQAALMAGVCVATGAITLLPAILLYLKTDEAKQAELEQIEQTRGGPLRPQQREQLDEHEETVRLQTPWPRGDWAFKIFLVMIPVVLFLLPFHMEHQLTSILKPVEDCLCR